eukprot:4634151-Amphidinium_carterae.1
MGVFIAGVAPANYAPKELVRAHDHMVPAGRDIVAPQAERPGNVRKIRCSPGIVIEVPRTST